MSGISLGPPGLRISFRPTLWASLVAFAVLTVLLGFGTWQIQRLHWKEALIAERQARASAPAIPLPAVIEAPEFLEHRRVTVTGRYLHARELYWGGRPRRGVVGFGVVTPFVLADGRGLLVHRGWVPPERKDPASRAADQPAETVELEALVRRGGWNGSTWFRPDNAPADNYWYWIDVPAMAARAGLAHPVSEIYLDLLGAAPGGAVSGGWPIAAAAPAMIINNHLAYAITWYGLAAVLLVIYVIFHSTRERAP